MIYIYVYIDELQQWKYQRKQINIFKEVIIRSRFSTLNSFNNNFPIQQISFLPFFTKKKHFLFHLLHTRNDCISQKKRKMNRKKTLAKFVKNALKDLRNNRYNHCGNSITFFTLSETINKLYVLRFHLDSCFFSYTINKSSTVSSLNPKIIVFSMLSLFTAYFGFSTDFSTPALTEKNNVFSLLLIFFSIDNFISQTIVGMTVSNVRMKLFSPIVFHFFSSHFH